MRIRAEGLTPSAPRFGLLSVAQVLEGDEQGDGRWLGGVTLDPAPCGCADGYDPACSDTPADVVEDIYPEAGPSLDFDPFMVSYADRCSVMGLGPFNEFTARLRTAFDAAEPAAIEAEFELATLVTTNPHLASTDADELYAGSVNLIDAYAALEGAIAASCRAGVIHTNVVAATWAAHLGLISRDGQVMRTGLGTPVAVGSGYTGASPDGAAPADGTSWLYATGPIRVRRGAVEQYPADLSGVDRSINRLVVRVERPVLVEWDRCLHAAVLADLGEVPSDFGS